MRAVEAPRKIPETKTRVEELHQRILKEQEPTVAHETTTHQVSTDISEIINATVAAFRSKPVEQVLLGLAMIDAPPGAASLRSSAGWRESLPTLVEPVVAVLPPEAPNRHRFEKRSESLDANFPSGNRGWLERVRHSVEPDFRHVTERAVLLVREGEVGDPLP